MSVAHSTLRPQAKEPAPQDKPIVVIGPEQLPDILVTGERPTIRGGLWRFVRSGTLMYGQGGSSRPFRFTLCLPDGALDATLRTVAGEQSAMPRDTRCGSLRLDVAAGRITGGRSCMRPLGKGDVKPGSSRLNMSGQYDAKRLTINLMSEDRFDGIEQGGGPGWNPQRPRGQRWRVEATRVGDCPLRRGVDQRTLEEAVDRLFDPTGTDDETDF